MEEFAIVGLIILAFLAAFGITWFILRGEDEPTETGGGSSGTLDDPREESPQEAPPIEYLDVEHLHYGSVLRKEANIHTLGQAIDYLDKEGTFCNIKGIGVTTESKIIEDLENFTDL